MRSDRLQRQIDRLLDQCEAALGEHQWQAARDAALAVLGMDPENLDARGFLAAAQSALAGSDIGPTPADAPPAIVPSPATGSPGAPTGLPLPLGEHVLSPVQGGRREGV